MSRSHKESSFAVVVHSHGRWILRVGGLILAMEGDPCRDASFVETAWTKQSLDDAAVYINDRLATEDGTQ